MSRLLISVACLLAVAAFCSAATVDERKCPLACEAGAAVEDQWLGIDEYSDLPENHRVAFAVLGWTEEAWDGCYKCWKNNWVYEDEEDGQTLSLAECVQQEYLSGNNPLCPQAEILTFARLLPEQQAAAFQLGYTADSWDATTPYSCCYEDRLDENVVFGQP